MITQQPATETEAAALRALGLTYLEGAPGHLNEVVPPHFLAAYRAGHDAGARPRVYREGDPAPTRSVTLLDREGDIETYHPGELIYSRTWAEHLAVYGPVVELPDYQAAMIADEKRRAGAFNIESPIPVEVRAAADRLHADLGDAGGAVADDVTTLVNWIRHDAGVAVQGDQHRRAGEPE